MTTALTRLSGSAFELTLTVPWPEIKEVYDKVFDELSSEMEIEGFRKGKAPKDLVAPKIDKGKIYGEVVNRILPKAYAKALEEHRLKPIISPQVQIVSGEEEKDWQFIAKATEKPSVDLDDYKKKVSELNAKGKIWTPQTTEDGKQKTDEEEAKQKKLSEIIDLLLQVCQVELPELLIESEVNRLLSQLIDDVRSAGLTYEQYLSSKGNTAEQLRQNYRKQVETTLKLEFILEAIADDLVVVVEQSEIDAVIQKETDQKRQEALKSQAYALSSVLRREKTLTKLTVL